MTENDSSTAVRVRGKGFPTLPLDEAAAAVKQAGQYGRAHSLGAFAGYLGHGTTNSGAFRGKMAALNDWGFVQRRGDEVALTDLAVSIAHPESEEAEHESLQEAFRHAGLFFAIYEDSAKGADLNLELIGNRAVTVFGVAAKSKKRFAESFAKSAVSAGLARMSSDATVELLPEGGRTASVKDGESPAEEDILADETGVPPSVVSVSPTHMPPTLHQEWEVRGGTLRFEAFLDSALPASAYGHIGSIADAVEQLVDFLGASDVQEDKPDPSGDDVPN